MESQNQDERIEEETTQAQESQEDYQDNETDNASSESESVQEDEESTQEESKEEVDWRARALKAEKAIEKAKKKGKNTESGVSPEEFARLNLKAEGIKEKEDQDYIMKVAEIEGVDIEGALKLDYVQDRMTANERKRQSAQATPKGNNRTNTQVDEVQSWVKKFKTNGQLPDNNPALTAKILRALKNGA